MSERQAGDAQELLPSSNRALLLFICLSLGLAWLVSLPLWVRGIDLTPSLGQGLAGSESDTTATETSAVVDSLITQLCALAMMLTPAMSAVVTLKICGVRFSRIFPLLGAGRPVKVPGFREPKRGAGAMLWRLVAALGYTLVLCMAITGIIFLATPAWPGNEHTLGHQLASTLGIPTGVLIAIQLMQVPLGAIFNALPAAGEELGWRAYLYPALTQRFGYVWAVVIGGIIWGVWHAPLIMLGYNFGIFGLPSVGLMVLACIGLGAWLSYLYGRAGSVWVPAVAHGTFNAVAGIPLLFWPAEIPFQGITASPLGLWALLILYPLAAWTVLSVRRTQQPNDLRADQQAV